MLAVHVASGANQAWAAAAAAAPAVSCLQVKGCTVDLTKLGKAYYMRQRACPMHLQ
jgi:hypothetical protein